MKAGSGYDSLTQVVKGDASGRGSDLELVAATNSTVAGKLEIKKIETTEELNNSLAVSASVEGSYNLFSASASASYLKETEVQSYSLFFLINYFVRNNEQLVKNYVLDQMLRALPPEEFRSRFGDYFVQGMVSGGTFYALLQLATNSQKTKEEISASAEANYGASAFSIGGKFSTDVKNAASHAGVNFSSKVSYTGPAPSWAQGQFDTVDQLLEAASEFPQAVNEGGEPVLAILMPYALLKDPPTSGKSIDLAAINSIRQTLTQVYLQSKQILDSVNYALRNPSQFSSDQVAGLAAVRQEMVRTIGEIFEANQQLEKDPTKAKDLKLPNMPDLSKIPRRLWGGTLTTIAPPEGVVPTTLKFKIGVARTEARKLTDTNLQNKCIAYLNQVEQDVTGNLSGAHDFIATLESSVRALNMELPHEVAKNLVANLVNKRDASAAALNNAIAQQKAQYATFANQNTENRLDFLEKNLNPVLWSTTEVQYGGVKFWQDLKKTTDKDLTDVTNAWAPKGKGGEYFSFAEGMWKLLGQSFKEAMLTLYNAGS
jgi:hypothetical protein